MLENIFIMVRMSETQSVIAVGHSTFKYLRKILSRNGWKPRVGTDVFPLTFLLHYSNDTKRKLYWDGPFYHYTIVQYANVPQWQLLLKGDVNSDVRCSFWFSLGRKTNSNMFGWTTMCELEHIGFLHGPWARIKVEGVLWNARHCG